MVPQGQEFAGLTYYHHEEQEKTIWEHPLDGYYKSILAQRRAAEEMDKEGKVKYAEQVS